ncbi:hypothetical protein BAUCODRAFT_348294 [Baudoinia panamericana UAMH 10762]|uniref:Glucose-methanol-choline oxidoreductase N-terminal domain-containing protein n=1 Tax=Baudoinia panamericana (strain UAMH 10762) TaxID=717646 RepID=M2MSA0_BAUPA|nr:uncharacterized protein BAUCODRAFT_348294 [Baudoinia panamericana UAMH 10762]EMC99736.1 hypothetical protein BAUCODRAFT_348294 [Baudoinia panamericana UAMH 10762]
MPHPVFARNCILTTIVALVVIIQVSYFSHIQHTLSRHEEILSSGASNKRREPGEGGGGVVYSTGDLHDEYDYIIVGGGQAGLTVGNRLSEGNDTVLVVEYGHLYRHDPLIARPWQPFDASHGLFHDPKLMFNFSSVPQQGLNNRTSEVSAAAVVGGGSTVNGMFLNRGAAEDYDAWEKLGNVGWGWKDLLPYFRKSVTFTPPGEMLQKEYNASWDEDAAYGEQGPVHLSNPAWAWPGQKVQIEGWQQLGVQQSREGAGGDAFGIFWVPRSQDPNTETRSYAVTAHLDPVLRRSNYHLLPGYRVNSVLLSRDHRAHGIVLQRRDGNDVGVVRARKEIILAAGGVQSPLILQRSGVGPKHVLEEAKIEVRVELPGVGMNLQDHPASGLAYEFTTDMYLNPNNMSNNATFAAEAQAQFERDRSGPYAGGHNTVAFLPSADFHPNTDALVSSVRSQAPYDHLPAAYASDPTLLAGYLSQRQQIVHAMSSRTSALIEMPLAGDAYCLLILQKPLSRGTVTVDPTDPANGTPRLDFGTLANPLDTHVLAQMYRRARQWYQTDAMQTLGPYEHSPGLNVQSDEELEAFIREHAESTIGHQSGTCAMLPRELGGVVDAELRVYGTRGLSVVDASVIPLIPSTNLCATVYAVAEKAADIIKSRHRVVGVKEEIHDLRL